MLIDTERSSMKKRILSIVSAALIVFLLGAPVLAGGIPSAVSRAANSAVRLTVKTSLGTERTTGTAIGKDSHVRYVLTSLHSVEAGEILVGTNEEQNIPAKVTVRSDKLDLAVLELGEELDGVKPAKFKKNALNDGDTVYTVGYYANEDAANISEGTVQSRNNFSANGVSAEIYRVSAAVTARNSGGMLLNKYGSAVGICYYDGNTSENKVITNNEIFAMLDENGVEYKKATIIYLLAAIILILAALCAAAYVILRNVKTKRANRPRLIGQTGEFAGEEIPVTAENINIGRDAKICQIVVLGDNKVSRCHCSVRYDEMKRTFILTDLSSTHGTYVNGAKLEPNVPKYIASGTVFNVGTGNTSFRAVEGGA